MKKYILLTAGYEYQNGGTFVGLADQRRQFLLGKHPEWRNDPEVIFVRFDAKLGKIDRNTSAAGAGTWTPEPGNFEAVNRRVHYREGHLLPSDNRLMSITDVYRYVINIGATEPATLLEFSILGHGWFGGPIMLNSFQREEYTSSGANEALRDPWDKDGRTKDFFSQNMTDADWVNFKNAFASDGYAWIWGCLFPRAYYDTLYKFMHTPAFKAKPMASLTDSDSFTITVNSTFVNDYYNVDRQFFPTDDNTKTFTRSLLDLKQYLKRGIRRSFPGRFVLDTGINCVAGYLGTYSDYERSYPGHPAPHPVMVIPRNTSVFGTDFTRVINFYKTLLNIAEDPDERGYAIYNAVQVNQWWIDTQ